MKGEPMKGIFSLDGPAMRVMTVFADLVILNLLTLFLSIPVVTGGAALTALDYCVLKIVRNEDSYTVRSYFKSFKENFVMGMTLWIPMAIVGFLTIFDLYIMRTAPNETMKNFRSFFVVIMFLMILVVEWVFPLLSHFEYKKASHYVRNAILMAIANLPRTAIMFVITIGPLVAMYFYFYQMMPVMFIIGLSLPAFLKAMVYNKAFEKLENQYQKKSDTSLEE
jgi:uncharacterized membrane protein YesL